MRFEVFVGCVAVTAAACGAFGTDKEPEHVAATGPRDPVGPAVDLATGQQTPGAVVVDGTSLYWINQASGGKTGAVMKMAKTGGAASILADAIIDPYALCSDATRVFFTDNDRRSGSYQLLWRQDKAGGPATSLQLNANDSLFGCSVQGGAVFWVMASDGGRVGLVDTDSWTSTSVLDIAKNLGAAKIVVASSTHVFVGGAGEILKISRADALKSSVATTAGAAKALVLESATSTLYWADASSVQKRDVGSLTAQAVVLASGQDGPSAIAVDATNVYWTNVGDGTVRRVPKAGGAITTISSGEVEPLGIAVDDSGLYWTNHGDGRVRVARR